MKALLTIGAFFLIGCAMGSRDISMDPTYRSLVGQEFVTKEIFVVWKDGKTYFLDRKSPVDKVATLPAGTHLRVTRVIEHNYYENSTHEPYAATEAFAHELNIMFLMDREIGQRLVRPNPELLGYN